MASGFHIGSIGEIRFDRTTDSEFKKELRADIAGIRPEDVEFKQLEGTPYDDIIKLQISCNTRLSEEEHISYSCVMDVDKREFYGFDYSVSNGLLYLTLYKEKKKDIQHIGFGFKFETKYPKKEQCWI